MIEGNENNDLENLEELDDITAVDLALKLSEYDDDELEEFLKKPTEEELAVFVSRNGVRGNEPDNDSDCID